MIRALIVDDHPIIVDALAITLKATKAVQEIEKVRSLREVLARLSTGANFSLIVLDLHLSDADGVASLTSLRENFPDIPVLIFSADNSSASISAAFEYGARGYVTKDSPLDVVMSAVKVVLAGSCYIPSAAVRLLGMDLRDVTPSRDSNGGEVLPYLSPRQRQTFELLLLGVPNKVIAARLEMAEGTVKTHLNTVFRVLGVRNRAQAILRARELGIL